MSVSKNDQILTTFITDIELTNLIKKILRQEYKDQSSAVKRISNKTGIELRAIRDWYEGRKPPKSIHLLLLASHYNEIFNQLIILTGNSHLLELYEQKISFQNLPSKISKSAESDEIYSARYCTINVGVDFEKAKNLNKRQLWYLGLLQHGYRVKIADIMAFWKVSARTAKYDISILAKQGLVQFVGSRKTGHHKSI